MKEFVIILAVLISTSASAGVTQACNTVQLRSTKGGIDQAFPATSDPIGDVGRVIAIGKDIVALGSELYTLVDKFKATVSTEYSPISVVPIDPLTKTYVNPFDLENFSDPEVKVFRTTCLNNANQIVVNFVYSIWYSYGGSFNGKGKYLSSVVVVPSYIQLGFGWTFVSSMKVSSVVNHGTTANPLAGLTLTLKYNISGWGSAAEKHDSFHIKGNGEMRVGRL